MIFFFLLGELKAWLKAKSIFTEWIVKMFFYVTFGGIILRKRKVFSCKNLLCWYNTHLSREKGLLLFVAYGMTSSNWDYIAKAMIQHILLHVTKREVFLLLIHAKVITELGTRQVELFLGEILLSFYSACFQHSKERS